MIKQLRYDDREAVLSLLSSRAGEIPAAVDAAVQEIIEAVAQGGDAALRSYSERFDGVSPDCFELPQSALKEAAASLDPELLETIKRARDNILQYHSLQKQEGYSFSRDSGALMGRMVRPLARVGVYVPGGTAAYPSTVLMNVIPAKVAGVGEIVMVTPPGKEGVAPAILAAAHIAGVDRVLTVGGAQAVAALAYGTESVPKVDKIVGPGNIYVAAAKRRLYGRVDIDMIAGPSEVCIVADEGASARFIAADMLAQAEHDSLASSVALCLSEEKAEAIKAELLLQTQQLDRKEIIQEALGGCSAIVVCPDLDAAMELANDIASEHLELMVKEPKALLAKFEHAGSVFLGAYTPEPLGDYFAGPNHVLPTSGTARFFSPLSVDSFVKKTSYLYYPQAALVEDAEDVIRFAMAEGLDAHANAVRVRLQQEGGAQ